jgi:molybdopterin molybdotransferase
MVRVTPLRFEAARQCVIDRLTAHANRMDSETVSIDNCFGRVLSQDVLADRNYPPLARSMRDGFAVRSADTPGRLRIAGEVRAGSFYTGEVKTDEAVEIMTGAPVPDGADAIVMVEHVRRQGDSVVIDRTTNPGDFINPKGAERCAGRVVLGAGALLNYPQIGVLATVGMTQVPVFRKPRVAILATGDEVVPIDEHPAGYQVRNSNAYSLAAQVQRAGAEPMILPVARDDYEHTRSLICQGLDSAELLLLSGGVSAGKYDIVETVLADMDATFYFDRVLIQPGQPLVFGSVADRFFFGLPGNPASTMVTFEIFARAALELTGGRNECPLPFTWARLTQELRHKTGLTRFLPARLAPCGLEVTPVKWQGSSDVFAQADANALLVADPDREAWAAGDLIRVLPQ